MPTGKQGTIGPAIARFIAQDRAGLCYQQTSGWKPAGLLPFPVLDAVGSLDGSGNIVIWPYRGTAGGGTKPQPIHYDTTTQQCTLGPNFPGDLNQTVTYCRLQDGRIFAHGPNQKQCYIYDPDTRIWTVTASMSVAKNLDCFVSIPGGSAGQVVNIGGNSGNTTIEIFDVGTGTWSISTSTYGVGASGATIVGIALDDGNVMVSWSDSVTQHVALWNAGLVGPITDSTNYFGVGNRFLGQGVIQVQNQFVRTDDGSILVIGYLYNYGQGFTIFRMSQVSGSPLVSVPVSRALRQSVGVTRAFDQKALMWDTYPFYFSGSLQGPVEYSNGTAKSLPLPSGIGPIAGYVGSGQDTIWYGFGGLSSDGNNGTRTIFSLKT